jgi:hypothetical protein
VETHPWDANRGKVVRPQAGNGWTVTTIEDGVDYYAFDGKESITGTNQHIYVTDIDLAKPYSVKLGTGGYTGHSQKSEKKSFHTIGH